MRQHLLAAAFALTAAPSRAQTLESALPGASLAPAGRPVASGKLYSQGLAVADRAAAGLSCGRYEFFSWFEEGFVPEGTRIRAGVLASTRRAGWSYRELPAPTDSVVAATFRGDGRTVYAPADPYGSAPFLHLYAASPAAGAVAAPLPYSRPLSLQAVRLYGPDVKAVQRRLLDLGYREVGEADGLFGPRTRGAVRRLQGASALSAGGVVGPNTRSRLFGVRPQRG